VRHDLQAIGPAAEAERQADSRLAALKPQIRFDNVTFAYSIATVPALEEVTFAIEEGESVGLVGGSGAGKSTLVDLLLGLLRPSSGKILVDGQPLADVRRQWQQAIGFVPQTVALLDAPVWENVAFGETAETFDPAAVQSALDAALLSDVVRTLPQGIWSNIGEQGHRLSGGQRQRLAVARALYVRPRFLVLDEATSALDNETESRLMEVLQELRTSGMTTLIIAHRLSTVKNSDSILYLEQGKLIGHDRFEVLMSELPSFRRLVELGTIDDHA